MENIIHFLALFTFTAAAVQLSLYRKLWLQLLLVTAITGITYFFYPIAITFSRDDIVNLLANPDAMLDLSVVLVLEALAMLILALFMVRDMYTRLTKPWSWILLVQYAPSVVTVGVLCFYQVHIYQQALPYDFDKIALAYGGGMALALFAFAWMIRFLVPLRVLRLELKLAMHAAQISLAVAISVLTSRYPYRSSDIEANVIQFAVVTVIIALGAAIGYWRHQRRLHQQFSLPSV